MLLTVDDTSALSDVPSLPVELLEHIVSFTTSSPNEISPYLESRRTWLSLSTVSWSFRSIVLPRLFKTIIIERTDECSHPGEDMDRTTSSTRTFCEAVSAGNLAALSLAQLVQECVLVTHRNEGYLPREATEGFSALYLNSVRRMVNIVAVSLVDSDVCSSTGLIELLTALPKLSELSLSRQSFYGASLPSNPEEMLQLQAICPALTRLEMLEVETPLNGGSHPPTHFVSTCTDLCWFSMRPSYYNTYPGTVFINNSLHKQSCHLLQGLELGAIQHSDVDALNELLNAAVNLMSLDLKYVRIRDSAADSPAALLSISPTALPVLTYLRCPPGWFPVLLPGRPVRDVDFDAAFQIEGVPGESLRSVTGLEVGNGSGSGLDCLQRTKGNLESISLTCDQYDEFVLRGGQDGPLELCLEELVLRGCCPEWVRYPTMIFNEGRYSSPPTLPSTGDVLRLLLELISRTPSALSLRRLCLHAFHPHWTDLPSQIELLSLVSAQLKKFPALQRIQISPYVEWRKCSLLPSIKPTAVTVWKPVLILSTSGHGDRYLASRKLERILTSTTLKKVKDLEGLFSGSFPKLEFGSG